MFVELLLYLSIYRFAVACCGPELDDDRDQAGPALGREAARLPQPFSARAISAVV
jgi:hypothetical protein